MSTPTTEGTNSINQQNSTVPAPTINKARNSGRDEDRGWYNHGPHNYTIKDAVTASLAKAADNGGPRKPMGQFDDPPSITSKKYGSGSGESEAQ